MMEKFSKFIKLCHEHAAQDVLMNDFGVKQEDKLIRQIQKEGQKLIRGGAGFEELLRYENEFVSFWCAMCCVDHSHFAETALKQLRYISTIEVSDKIHFRAELVLSLFDDGCWKIDKSGNVLKD